MLSYIQDQHQEDINHKMKETIIADLTMFHKKLATLRKSTTFKFRGQSNADWKLVPKAGRDQFSHSNDEMLFKQWKRRAVSLLNNDRYNDWELLSIAQHTGLPTRMLDWTHNPLTAAFFLHQQIIWMLTALSTYTRLLDL